MEAEEEGGQERAHFEESNDDEIRREDREKKEGEGDPPPPPPPVPMARTKRGEAASSSSSAVRKSRKKGGGASSGDDGRLTGVSRQQLDLDHHRRRTNSNKQREFRSRLEQEEDISLPSTPRVKRRSSHREAPSINSVAEAAKTLYHERRGSLRTIATSIIGGGSNSSSKRGSFRRLLHSSSRTPTTTAASSIGGSSDSLASRAASTASSSFNSPPSITSAPTTAFYDPLEAGKRGLIEDAAAAAAIVARKKNSGGSELVCTSLPVSPTRRNFSDHDLVSTLQQPQRKQHGDQHRRADSLRSHTRRTCEDYRKSPGRSASSRRPQGARRHTSDAITPAEVVSALTLSGVTDDLKARLLGGEPSFTSSPCLARKKMTPPKVAATATATSATKSTSINGSGVVTMGRSSSDSGFEASSFGSPANGNLGDVAPIKKVDLDEEYDIVQKIGEGWFSRVYLTEHRQTRQELVLKAINSKTVSAEEFLREYRYAALLSPHRNCITVLGDSAVFQAKGYYMFATEYAPFGDLTSNVGDRGVGEQCAKRIAKQVALALEWVHGLGLCHLDVKLDNILVFRSDFSWVKLCDFGAVRPQGDLAVKKNELLPYCPPELAVLPSGQSYRVDRSQDVFQFGVVTFFCVFGALPWQRAGGPDPSDAADPGYAEFAAWRAKKPGARTPRAFKPLTSRGQKFFRKLMDVDPAKRLALSEVPKFLDDRWMKKSVNGSSANENTNDGCRFLSDGVSQLTMGSFRSVHSNAAEKNKVLYTLLQHGVETTVDRSQKNSRIINWIRHGRPEVTKDEQDDEDNELNEDAKIDKSVVTMEDFKKAKTKNVFCNGDKALKNSTVCQSD